MLKKFSKFLTHINHETVFDLPIEKIRDHFTFLAEHFSIEHTIEDELAKYNDDILDETVVEEEAEESDDESDEEDDEESEEDDNAIEDSIEHENIMNIAEKVKQTVIDKMTEQLEEKRIKKECRNCCVLYPEHMYELCTDRGSTFRRNVCDNCRQNQRKASRRKISAIKKAQKYCK